MIITASEVRMKSAKEKYLSMVLDSGTSEGVRKAWLKRKCAGNVDKADADVGGASSGRGLSYEQYLARVNALLDRMTNNNSSEIDAKIQVLEDKYPEYVQRQIDGWEAEEREKNKSKYQGRTMYTQYLAESPRREPSRMRQYQTLLAY